MTSRSRPHPSFQWRFAASLMFAAALSQGAHGQTRAPRPILSGQISQPPLVAPHAHRSIRRLKPGMLVIDRRGNRVGIIQQVHQLRDGKPAVLVSFDGTLIKVRTSKLRITQGGDEARTSLTPSQIRTATILNAP